MFRVQQTASCFASTKQFLTTIELTATEAAVSSWRREMRMKMSGAAALGLIIGAGSLTGISNAADREVLGMSATGNACPLLSAADAERLSRVPMSRIEGSSTKAMCNYTPTKTLPGPDIFVHLEVDSDNFWKVLRAGILGPLHSDGLAGIGDEAYYQKEGTAPGLLKTTLFVRKGTSYFSLRVSGPNLSPWEEMKNTAKRIAAQL
jgi:hypothetical protein